MINKKTKEVLEKQLELTKLSEKEERELKQETAEFVKKLKAKIKEEVFIGGSLAKGTLVQKKVQDVDIFARFKNEEATKKIRKLKIKGYKRKLVHGSRDYLQFSKGKIMFEVVPVLKISKPNQAENVTDLSYFHVNYIKKQITKNKKLADEIKLAKAFCFAQDCYGAESFIKGFSGYGLELLISYYGSFRKWLENMSKVKDKLVIDPKKHYKKNEVLIELNESKLSSPVVFVDPTFKQRNALAALSVETFAKFQKAASGFLKNPSLLYFKKAEIDKKKFNLILTATTSKQPGDIAGTKLLKFFNYLKKELEKRFVVERADFKYDDRKKAYYYFKIKEKDLIVAGPFVKMKEALAFFKKAHKSTFIKQGRVYAKLGKISIKDFLKKLDKKVMREMGIEKLEREK